MPHLLQLARIRYYPHTNILAKTSIKGNRRTFLFSLILNQKSITLIAIEYFVAKYILIHHDKLTPLWPLIRYVVYSSIMDEIILREFTITHCLAHRAMPQVYLSYIDALYLQATPRMSIQ